MIVIAALFGLAMYFLPTIVAGIRKVPNFGSVLVLNLFLGWSLVGWVVAMAMAARSQPVAVTVQVVNNQLSESNKSLRAGSRNETLKALGILSGPSSLYRVSATTWRHI